MSGDEESAPDPAADAVHQARSLLNGILDEMNAGYRAAPTSVGDEEKPSPEDRVSLNGLLDLATELAELVMRVAGKIAEDVTKAAAEFGAVIVRRAADGSLSDPPRGSDPPSGPTLPATLSLPDVSPGQTTSALVEVRNDSLETVDGLRLRCPGLFGSGEERILGYRVSFSPLVVDVEPGGRASVTCSLAVPPDTKRARYVGLIEAAGTPGVQLLVSLNVI